MCQRTSHRIYQFILAKAFEVPRNFSRKVSLVRVWGGQPQLIMHTKSTASPCFFIFHYMLELRSKPSFLTFLERKVNPKNFPSNMPVYFLFFKAFSITLPMTTPIFICPMSFGCMPSTRQESRNSSPKSVSPSIK